MECGQAKTEIIAYLKDELNAAKREKLEMHLASCPDCRRELEEAKRLLEWTEAASSAAIVRTVDDTIDKAIEAQASDIHFESQNDDTLRVRYRIDGVLHEVDRFPAFERQGVIARVKMMADMNVGETKLPQDGIIRMRKDNKQYDVRVSAIPFIFGESIVMRILDREFTLPSLDKIHLYDDHMEQLEHLRTRPMGLLIVAGPTGSGKTTTCYSLLDRLNHEHNKIVTVEDPVEISIPGISQAHVNVRAGFTFAVALRSFLRHDPDIVYVGEMRGKEEVTISAQAALTGHLVMASLHVNDAMSAPSRLIEMGLEPYAAGAALIGVVSQRLVRVICSHCREEVKIDLDDPVIAFFGIKPDELAAHKMFRGRGCDSCRSTGYKGRAGLYEILTLDKELGAVIAKGGSAEELLEAAKAKGFQPMREDAKRKVLDGLTTPEEAFRVLM